MCGCAVVVGDRQSDGVRPVRGVRLVRRCHGPGGAVTEVHAYPAIVPPDRNEPLPIRFTARHGSPGSRSPAVGFTLAGGAVTVTCRVAVSVAPSSSVTVSVTVYARQRRSVVRRGPVPVVLSPKFPRTRHRPIRIGRATATQVHGPPTITGVPITPSASRWRRRGHRDLPGAVSVAPSSSVTVSVTVYVPSRGVRVVRRGPGPGGAVNEVPRVPGDRPIGSEEPLPLRFTARPTDHRRPDHAVGFTFAGRRSPETSDRERVERQGGGRPRAAGA